MNILVLEHPRVPSKKRFNDIANTPLWSCLMGGYSAASLKAAGFSVRYLDAATQGLDFYQTARAVLDLSPEMLCVNTVYFWEHTPKFFEFLEDLRANGYRGHISLFGFFPSMAFRRILETIPEVDSIAVGECEDTLAALARTLHGSGEWRETAGLAFRSSCGVDIRGRRRPAKNPDKYPFPDRPHAAAGDTVSILASRGCYNHCSFCPISGFYNEGPLWRGRSPENVRSEISGLMDLGVRDFYFVDPNFIGPGRAGRLRALEIARHLRPLNIAFGMETRPDDLDAELMDRLSEAGLKSMLLGIESASPSVLNGLNKSVTTNAGEHAVSLCRAVGIEPQIGFIMFIPDSRLEDLERNLAFLLRNNLLDRLDRTVNLLSHSQIVLMGTPGYRRFETQGRLTPVGFLGFEGRVRYVDARVAWVARIMIDACREVLREMDAPDSPLYWRHIGGGPGDQGINAYLVDLFRQLLQEARNAARLPSVGSVATEVRNALHSMVSTATLSKPAFK
jgi:radical SAM superfamily enzyme YgiQ (UPF0313 family)